MNFVLYADDMEPITVLKLPYTVRTLKLLKMERVLFAVPMEVKYVRAAEVPEQEEMKTVEVWWELFIRHGREHYFFFTKDEENALLLTSELLAGQRKEHQREFKRGFVKGLVAAMGILK